MTDNIDRATRDLFEGRRTRNVKYYVDGVCSAEQLADYQHRVRVQIREGVSRENTILDSEILD